MDPQKEGSGYTPLKTTSGDAVVASTPAEPPPKDWKTCDLMSDLRAVRCILMSCVNVFLVFVPIGLMSASQGWNSAIIFTTNWAAIIPLCGILGAATEALAEHTGQTVGGLVNATFGNAVEIIITIDAIKRGLCGVVQAGLIGSVLSNLLLVLGMAFIASGILRSEQSFNKDGAGANASCLLVAAIGVVLPTLFDQSGFATDSDSVLLLSRMCAIIMFCVYFFFLVFQLITHEHHFADASIAVTQEEIEGAGEFVSRISKVFVSLKEDDGTEDPELSPIGSVVLLAVTTLIVCQHSELMVGSIERVTDDFNIPQSFIGLILLPVVGNAAEHITAVTSAFKGKMDLAIGVAVGSSTQISLCVVPFSIITGWYLDQPMDLNFGAFNAGVFLLTVFLVGSVLQDGASNWLEGVMLLGTYVMIAVISWYL